MLLKDYIQLSARTEKEIGSPYLCIVHMLLGIFGEWNAEVLPADDGELPEEFGDLMFYIAGYIRRRELIIPENILNNRLPADSEIINIGLYLGKLAEHEKKVLAYGIPLNREYLSEQVSNAIIAIDHTCENYLDISLDEILQMNHDKLLKRYPEGFTETDAIQRKDEDPDQ